MVKHAPILKIVNNKKKYRRHFSRAYNKSIFIQKTKLNKKKLFGVDIIEKLDKNSMIFYNKFGLSLVYKPLLLFSLKIRKKNYKKKKHVSDNKK